MKYRSVPALMAEKWVWTRTSPARSSGSGTSRTTARPPAARTRFMTAELDSGGCRPGPPRRSRLAGGRVRRTPLGQPPEASPRPVSGRDRDGVCRARNQPAIYRPLTDLLFVRLHTQSWPARDLEPAFDHR